MIKIDVKTKFEKPSKVTKMVTISSETRWSAKVTRLGLLDNVYWTVYAGQLVIKSGKTFFFKDAVQDARSVLESYLRDPLFKY